MSRWIGNTGFWQDEHQRALRYGACVEGLGRELTEACLRRGLHINIAQLPGMGGIFRRAPPLKIDEHDLEFGLKILEEAILECAP